MLAAIGLVGNAIRTTSFQNVSDFAQGTFEFLVAAMAILGAGLLFARSRSGIQLGTIGCGFIFCRGIFTIWIFQIPEFVPWAMTILAIPAAVLMNVRPAEATVPSPPGIRRPGLATTLAILIAIGSLAVELTFICFTARPYLLDYLLPLIPLAGAILMLLRQTIGIPIAAFGAGIVLFQILARFYPGPDSMEMLFIVLGCLLLLCFLSLLAHPGVERALSMPPPSPPQPYMRPSPQQPPYPPQPPGWQQPPWPPR